MIGRGEANTLREYSAVMSSRNHILGKGPSDITEASE